MWYNDENPNARMEPVRKNENVVFFAESVSLIMNGPKQTACLAKGYTNNRLNMLICRTSSGAVFCVERLTASAVA